MKHSDLTKKDQATDESGIMYRAGVKKYGKDGMKKIQSAAGKGASAEEIGKIKDQHNKKKKESVQEDLAQMAQKAEMDHEVQMARSDLYKAAKYSIALHEMLKNVSEEQGLEGWVAAKITKAADYLSSVKHYMEYEMISAEEVQPAVEQVKESMACDCDKNCACGGNCTPNCNCHPGCGTPTKEDYKESLATKLQDKLKESTKTCKDCGKPTWETLDEAEKQKGVDGKVCWKGYKRMGTKMKGGKRVDNCVPIKKK